jgi:acyl dehydratase
MAIRGVYNKAEQKMMDETNKAADEIVGWAKYPDRVAKAEEMKAYGRAVDWWNPLYHDEEYAEATRWGGLIAFPCYQERYGQTHFSMIDTPEVGIMAHKYIGEDWKFYLPIRPGDKIKVWNDRPQFEDITSLDGKGDRRFTMMPHDKYHLNQNDQLVSSYQLFLEMNWHPKLVLDRQPGNEYIYTMEELDYLDRLAEQEEVFGVRVRWWENVKIGDRTKPIVTGPTDLADSPPNPEMMMKPIRVMLKEGGESLMLQRDPISHAYKRESYHNSDRAAQRLGHEKAWHFGISGRNPMLRCLTNWMGNDGFIREFSWRHVAQSSVGDTRTAWGKVTNKRVVNGEHLVDLEVWHENMRGNINEAACATICLLSKESPLWFKKYASRGHPILEMGAENSKRGGKQTVKIKPGDRVRIKDRKDWPSPPGYRFAGAEGMVIKWTEYDKTMENYQNYIYVDLDKCQDKYYIGRTVFFLAENLEKV